MSTLKKTCLISLVPAPTSVTLTGSNPSPIRPGSDVRLICSVKLSPLVVESDLSVLLVDAQLSRDGTPLALTGNPVVAGTIFTYTMQLDSFGKSDSGNYTCTATVRSNSTYLINSGSLMSGYIEVSTGVEIYYETSTSSAAVAASVAVVCILLLSVVGFVLAIPGIKRYYTDIIVGYCNIELHMTHY